MSDDEPCCAMCGAPVPTGRKVCDACNRGDRPRPAPVARRSSVPPVKVIVIGAAAVAGIVILIALSIPIRRRMSAAKWEREAAQSLREIHHGEEQFLARGNKSYWTADVAGLWAMMDVSVEYKPGWKIVEASRIRLISLDLALADQNPLRREDLTPGSGYEESINTNGRQAAHGFYWFRNISGSDSSRFAICAMPEQYGPNGMKVLLIDESGKLYQRDFDENVLHPHGTPPELSGPFSGERPSADELGSLWSSK